jgi:Rieske Fe-S protein
LNSKAFARNAIIHDSVFIVSIILKGSFMERRIFLKTSGSIIVGITGVGQLISSCSKDKTCPMQTNQNSDNYVIDLNQPANQVLSSVNGALKFDDVPGYALPVIVIRTSQTEVAAFSSRCTHAGCEIDLPVNAMMVCSGPCGHGSQFSLSGENVRGPAPSPLEEIQATLEENQIVLHLGP